MWITKTTAYIFKLVNILTPSCATNGIDWVLVNNY